MTCIHNHVDNVFQYILNDNKNKLTPIRVQIYTYRHTFINRPILTIFFCPYLCNNPTIHPFIHSKRPTQHTNNHRSNILYKKSHFTWFALFICFISPDIDIFVYSYSYYYYYYMIIIIIVRMILNHFITNVKKTRTNIKK